VSDQPEDRTRGSGEKLAGVDNGLTFEKSREDTGVLMAYPIKTRWNADLKPFRVRFGSDSDTGAVSLRWIGDASAEEIKKELGKSIIVAKAIAALQEQFGPDITTETTIQGYCEWSESVTRRVLSEMVKAGQVRTRKIDSSGGRRPTVYDLSEDM